jgi:hypothetical protein
VLYAIATIAGSTVWLWPHLLHFSQVPDRGDPIVSAWRLARLAHQLATDPGHPFDGNIFYPLPPTPTYSDATVLQGILGALLMWMGVEPPRAHASDAVSTAGWVEAQRRGISDAFVRNTVAA